LHNKKHLRHESARGYFHLDPVVRQHLNGVADPREFGNDMNQSRMETKVCLLVLGGLWGILWKPKNPPPPRITNTTAGIQ
jgi:hypothetical protein